MNPCLRRSSNRNIEQNIFGLDDSGLIMGDAAFEFNWVESGKILKIWRDLGERMIANKSS